MRKVNLLFIIIGISSVNAAAFFNTDNFAPFGLDSGNNNSMPWGSNSMPWNNNTNWNPMLSNGHYSPSNDARNMSRFGAHPTSLKNYRDNPGFVPSNTMFVPNQVQPSNWLKDTDFSKTLEHMTNSSSKTFFVNEMPINLDSGFQHIQDQTIELEKAVNKQVLRYGNTESIYGKQGYELSPAASTTPRVVVE